MLFIFYFFFEHDHLQLYLMLVSDHEVCTWNQSSVKHLTFLFLINSNGFHINIKVALYIYLWYSFFLYLAFALDYLYTHSSKQINLRLLVFTGSSVIGLNNGSQRFIQLVSMCFFFVVKQVDVPTEYRIIKRCPNENISKFIPCYSIS